MLRISRLLPALCAFFVAAFVLSACGDESVPGNAVARVGDDTITNTEFNRWMRIASISTQGQAPGAEAGRVAVPNPPAHTACVAAKRRNAAQAPEGQPTPTAAQFKQQCQQEYEGLRDQVMQFLINYEWVSGEADDLGVEVTAKEVNDEITATREQSFPEDEDFEKFLSDSGLTLNDIRFQVRLNQLQIKLREKISEDSDEISNDEVREYYAENRERFAMPETRDLRVVLTRGEDRAQAARAALEGGSSWSDVATEFSIDEASKAEGGTLLGVAKGQQEQALDEAIFEAEQGELTGPVETQFGFYVFQVQKVTAPAQQTLTEAAPAIRQLLTAEAAQEVEEEFGEDFSDKWKDDTICREGFKVPLCKGEDDPEPQTAPAGQGDGQQAPPPQGQQQAPPPQQQAPPPQQAPEPQAPAQP